MTDIWGDAPERANYIAWDADGSAIWLEDHKFCDYDEYEGMWLVSGWWQKCPQHNGHMPGGIEERPGDIEVERGRRLKERVAILELGKRIGTLKRVPIMGESGGADDT